MTIKDYLSVAPEIQQAIDEGRPVVALESTILSHGMPYPEHLSFAREVEKIIRELERQTKRQSNRQCEPARVRRGEAGGKHTEFQRCDSGITGGLPTEDILRGRRQLFRIV